MGQLSLFGGLVGRGQMERFATRLAVLGAQRSRFAREVPAGHPGHGDHVRGIRRKRLRELRHWRAHGVNWRSRRYWLQLREADRRAGLGVVREYGWLPSVRRVRGGVLAETSEAAVVENGNRKSQA